MIRTANRLYCLGARTAPVGSVQSGAVRLFAVRCGVLNRTSGITTKSSISNSTNNLLPPPLSSYPPMPHPEIDLKYIPLDPLYLPRHRPSLPFRLGEDISRTGAGTRYIGITAREPALAYLSLRQDSTLSHYSQPFPPDDVIDPETRNVLKRCTRVGRVAWLLWKEIVLLFRACAPQ